MELLGVLLGAMLIAMLMMVVVVVLAVSMSARAVNKHNRVSPDVPSPAPKSWTTKPTAAARLHRRLRAAITVARTAAAAAPSSPRLAEVAAELEREAVALDTRLVMIDKLTPAERKAQLAIITPEVNQVERIASSLSVEAVQSQAPVLHSGEQPTLDRLAHELDTMEAARIEVAQINAEAGLHRPSPYAQGTPSPGTTRRA